MLGLSIYQAESRYQRCSSDHKQRNVSYLAERDQSLACVCVRIYEEVVAEAIIAFPITRGHAITGGNYVKRSMKYAC